MDKSLQGIRIHTQFRAYFDPSGEDRCPFEKLEQAVREFVHQTLRYFLSSNEDISDAYQEVLVCLFRLSQFDAQEPGRTVNYLSVTARNCAFRLLKQRRRWPCQFPESAEEALLHSSDRGPDEPLLQLEKREQLAHAIQALPSKLKEPIRLHLAGMTQVEIAQRFKVTASCVSLRLKSAVERIKRKCGVDNPNRPDRFLTARRAAR